AASLYQPSVVAKYLILLCQTFNRFYSNVKIVCDDIITLNSNLILINEVNNVIKHGLELLGIKIPSEM
ncbi:MAG: arginine--tRNA ligase, partial [Acholeplasmatales bacterium]|nr:arginine--tRNA ligase [Acholeplasmatales bacterium]